MRLTVVPSDKLIRQDEILAFLPTWPFDDSDVHAIQWYDTFGEIEHNTQPALPNTAFTEFSVVEPYVDAFNDFVASQAEEAPSEE